MLDHYTMGLYYSRKYWRFIKLSFSKIFILVLIRCLLMDKRVLIICAFLSIMVCGCGSSSITGGAVLDEPELEDVVEACTDSDNGVNINMQGKVYFESEGYADECVGGILVEYYCEDQKVANQNIRCENECVRGKCI